MNSGYSYNVQKKKNRLIVHIFTLSVLLFVLSKERGSPNIEFAYGSTYARNLIECCIKIVYYMSFTF